MLASAVPVLRLAGERSRQRRQRPGDGRVAAGARPRGADQRRRRQGPARRGHRVHLDWAREAGTSRATRSQPSRRRSRRACTRKTASAASATRWTTSGRGPSSTAGRKWSGNIPVRKQHRNDPAELRTGEAAAPGERQERQVTTPSTVHALLLLYEKDENAVRTWARQVEDALAAHNVSVVHRLAARAPARP